MPLNSLKCSQCGSHVNYAVDIEASEQTVVCKRCGTSTTIAQKDLDATVLASVQELIAQRAAEKAQENAYLQEHLDDENSVDEAIDKAQGAFQEAKDKLLTLTDAEKTLTNTMAIVDEFVVGAELDGLLGAKAVAAGSGASAAAAGAGTAAAATVGATAATAATATSAGAGFASKKAVDVPAPSDARFTTMAAFYAKELYNYCKRNNIKLLDAASDVHWQQWFIGTLKVSESYQAALSELVASEDFRRMVSRLMGK